MLTFEHNQNIYKSTHIFHVFLTKSSRLFTKTLFWRHFRPSNIEMSVSLTAESFYRLRHRILVRQTKFDHIILRTRPNQNNLLQCRDSSQHAIKCNEPRVKKIRITFKNTILYGIWNSRPFLRCSVAGKKRAGISNHVKNPILESCSNIFFPLVKKLFLRYH